MENNFAAIFARSVLREDIEIPQFEGNKVSAIIQIDGKIPLFKRQGKDGHIWWDLPGGKPEPEDKSVFDTVIREVKEELDIIVVPDFEILDIIQHPYKPQLYQQFIRCDYVSGTPVNALPDEHLEMRLVESEEAVRLLGNRISFKVAADLLSLNSIPVANSAPFSEDEPKPALERQLKNG